MLETAVDKGFDFLDFHIDFTRDCTMNGKILSGSKNKTKG